MSNSALAGLDLLATAIVLIDTSLVVRYVNPAAENLFEFSSKSIEGHTITEVFQDSVLDATVARHDEAFQLTVLASAAGELQVPRLAAPVGSAVRAYIRARDVMISLRPPEEISALNVLPGRIAAVAPDANGAQADVRLDCNGAVLSARLTAKSVHRLAWRLAGRYLRSSKASPSSVAECRNAPAGDFQMSSNKASR